ncbi:MAG: cupin domain-containing protein [Acidobacteriales bacterium]|nr:cupin domain-containing protein [Terriglobales bacterium]
MAIAIYEWSQIAAEQMTPQLTRQVIYGENMTVARICIEAGVVVAEHHHISEEFLLLEQGKARLSIGGEEKLIAAGQVIRIPSNTAHKFVAIEDCVAIDLFAPGRLDWIRGEDAYLRK